MSDETTEYTMADDAQVQMYNFPWSGRINGHVNCCLYCGNKGSTYQISSHAGRCLDQECRKRVRDGAEPIPELLKKSNDDFDRLVRGWCSKNHIDYEATVKNYYANLGPQSNTHKRYKELEAEGKTDNDYTVYINPSQCRKIDEPHEISKK